jgi:DNA-binding Xre family transcriptional regulator
MVDGPVTLTGSKIRRSSTQAPGSTSGAPRYGGAPRSSSSPASRNACQSHETAEAGHTRETGKEEAMSDFDKLCAEIAARPGAEARITAEVERMNKVLELEKVRARKKLTQSEVAARMGLSQRRVSAIEHTGSGEIKIDTLRRYVESLGGRLEVSAVVDGDHTPLSLG